METTSRKYLPAAGCDLFLPFYDPFMKLFGAEETRRRLMEQASLQPLQRVLEIGCGTGTLLLLIKKFYPTMEVVGLDPDPKALKRAGLKSRKAGVEIQLDRDFSNELPYPDSSLDRVFSSFMFHHIPEEEKQKTFIEVRRVLKPGGSFHMVDFGGNKSGLARWIHSVKGNTESRVRDLMIEAELSTPEVVRRESLFFLPVVYYRAQR